MEWQQKVKVQVFTPKKKLSQVRLFSMSKFNIALQAEEQSFLSGLPKKQDFKEKLIDFSEPDNSEPGESEKNTSRCVSINSQSEQGADGP